MDGDGISFALQRYKKNLTYASVREIFLQMNVTMSLFLK